MEGQRALARATPVTSAALSWPLSRSCTARSNGPRRRPRTSRYNTWLRRRAGESVLTRPLQLCACACMHSARGGGGVRDTNHLQTEKETSGKKEGRKIKSSRKKIKWTTWLYWLKSSEGSYIARRRPRRRGRSWCASARSLPHAHSLARCGPTSRTDLVARSEPSLPPSVAGRRELPRWPQRVMFLVRRLFRRLLQPRCLRAGLTWSSTFARWVTPNVPWMALLCAAQCTNSIRSWTKS